MSLCLREVGKEEAGVSYTSTLGYVVLRLWGSKGLGTPRSIPGFPAWVSLGNVICTEILWRVTCCSVPQILFWGTRLCIIPMAPWTLKYGSQSYVVLIMVLSRVMSL